MGVNQHSADRLIAALEGFGDTLTEAQKRLIQTGEAIQNAAAIKVTSCGKSTTFLTRFGQRKLAKLLGLTGPQGPPKVKRLPLRLALRMHVYANGTQVEHEDGWARSCTQYCMEYAMSQSREEWHAWGKAMGVRVFFHATRHEARAAKQADRTSST